MDTLTPSAPSRPSGEKQNCFHTKVAKHVQQVRRFKPHRHGAKAGFTVHRSKFEVADPLCPTRACAARGVYPLHGDTTGKGAVVAFDPK